MSGGRYLPSVRVRLTLWNVAVILVVLGVYAASVFTFVSRNASNGLDERLRADFQWPREMLNQLPGGGIGPDDASVDSESSPWLQVWSLSGEELLYSTLNAQRNPVPKANELAGQAEDRIVRTPELDPPWRVLSGRSTIGGQPVVIQVASSEFQMRRDMRELMLVLLLGLPLGVAAAGLGGYSLARRALAPVSRMAEHARLISAERLEDRLPVDNPDDELGKLASVFNETLTRLETSFEQMRSFTSDASHELRTPLTALRSVGEVGLRGQREPAAYREIIASMLEEVDHLAHLVDRLLLLSRADRGHSALAAETVKLGTLVDEVTGQLAVLAEEKDQAIEIDCRTDPKWIGDRLMLRQALLNLIDNAIKYTPEGGRITIRVEESSTEAILEVSDTGPGIPSELKSRIFDRFYRVESSRTREKGGTGLGLSIAKWTVEANGGQLSLENNGGIGSTFRITLPRRVSNGHFVPARHAG